VPAPLPAFLGRCQAPFLRAGSQLRLLHSAPAPEVQRLAEELASLSELAQGGWEGGGGAARAGGAWLQLAGDRGLGGAAGAAGEGEGEGEGSELLLSPDALHAAAAAGRAADAARRAAVDACFAGLAAERRAASAAQEAVAAGRARALRLER
jgi:hypothetical protein